MASFPTRAPDAFFEHWAKIRADPTNVTRAIVADDEVVGDIGSWLADDGREVGYWIGCDHGGRGSRRQPSGSCSTRSRAGRSRRTSR
jgi:RimJ/RimL family protein N-acetyltransferase